MRGEGRGDRLDDRWHGRCLGWICIKGCRYLATRRLCPGCWPSPDRSGRGRRRHGPGRSSRRRGRWSRQQALAVLCGLLAFAASCGCSCEISSPSRRTRVCSLDPADQCRLFGPGHLCEGRQQQQAARQKAGARGPGGRAAEPEEPRVVIQHRHAADAVAPGGGLAGRRGPVPRRSERRGSARRRSVRRGPAGRGSAGRDADRRPLCAATHWPAGFEAEAHGAVRMP